MDLETTDEVQKVQKVHQNQVDVSRNQLQNIKLFRTTLGNENENSISMETVSQNHEITYEILINIIVDRYQRTKKTNMSTQTFKIRFRKAKLTKKTLFQVTCLT